MLLPSEDFGRTQELTGPPHGQDGYATFLDSIDDTVFAVRDFAVIRMLDFRNDAAGLWKALQPIG